MNHGQDSRKYVLVEGIQLHPLAGELIAVDTVRDEVHHLNKTAALILRACDGRTGEEILVGLAEEYPDVPREELKADMTTAITEFESKGVIQGSPPQDGVSRSGSD